MVRASVVAGAVAGVHQYHHKAEKNDGSPKHQSGNDDLRRRSEPPINPAFRTLFVSGSGGRTLEAIPAIDASRHRLDLLRQEQVDLEQHLTDLDKLWSSRREKLLHRVEEATRRREEWELELYNVAPHLSPNAQLISADEEYPGPKALRWVEGPLYVTACMLVIVVHVACIALEFRFELLRAEMPALKQAFLAWYTVELVLKSMLYKRSLLCGDLRTVVWHWLDMVLVTEGVLEQWILPLVELLVGMAEGELTGGGTHSRPPVMAHKGIKLLRVLRILRVFRIVKFLMKSDLSWTEGTAFQSFIMGVIALNTILLGLELDIPWDGWYWIEQLLLVVYLFELVVRMKRSGPLSFFMSPQDWTWNWMDFIIVAGALSDQWLLPVVNFLRQLMNPTAPRNHVGHSKVLSMLRMLRLVRILRLVRLLRAIKPLFQLLVGIIQALQAILWVLLLTFIVLYAFAILATSLVGHGLIFGEDDDRPADLPFQTVPESMFLLFKLMNDDQSVVDPLNHSPYIRTFFVVFMVLTNWAILAIFTSVMSESLLAVTKQSSDAQSLERERKSGVERTEFLMSLFEELDGDTDRRICEAEFTALLEDRVVTNELCHFSGLTRRDLMDLFEFLCEEDEDGVQRVHYHTFVEQLETEGNSVRQRSMFRMENRLKQMERRLDARIKTRMEELRGRIECMSHAPMVMRSRSGAATAPWRQNILDRYLGSN